jgi:hypothetical protein
MKTFAISRRITIVAPLLLVAALAPASLARDAHSAATSPARADASAALAGAKANLSAGAVAGLLAGKRIVFTFPSSAGTCPPGTSDAAYCLGATGTLSFTLVLSAAGTDHVNAASTHAHIKPASTISVSATLSHSALALLRRAHKHDSSLKASLSAEATLSATSFYTAHTTVTIR